MAHLSAFEQSVPYISWLPNELLVQVFLLYAEGATPTSQRHTPQLAKMRWLPLMLVCRHWRDVALASPILWRVVHPASQTQWTTLVLARSAPATIDLTFRDRGSLFMETFKAVSTHVDRLQKLRFISFHPDLRHATLRFLCSAVGFPTLETLEYLINTRDPEAVGGFADIELSSECFSCLQSLQLYIAVALQDQSLCEKPRVLCLTRCLCGPSFDAFLNILSSCNVLQVFTMVACLQYLSDESSIPQRTPIHLLNLTTLSLRENPPAHTSQFLSCLFLPPMVKVSIMATHRDGGCAPSISCILPPRHTDVFPALAQCTDVRLLVLHKYALCFDIPAHTLSCASLFLSHGEVTLSSAALDLTRVFGRAPLTHLSISSNGDHIPPSDVWISIFRTFPRLEWLRARTMKFSMMMANPFKNLPVGLHNTLRSRTMSPPCLELGVITVNGMATDIDYFNAWVECLRGRLERGLVLPKLEIDIRGSKEDAETVSRILEGKLPGLVSEYSVESEFSGNR
ncbi:hypothetical protein V8D89_000012 [Ganoderma adspersum]